MICRVLEMLLRVVVLTDFVHQLVWLIEGVHNQGLQFEGVLRASNRENENNARTVILNQGSIL